VEHGNWSIIRCQPGDENRIRKLSDIIWKPTFQPILPPERVDYLYEWMYNPEKLRNLLTSEDSAFYIINGDDRDVGYGQLVFHERWVKLEKLYIHPGAQGKGCGLYLLRYLIAQLVDKECYLVRLQVNRGNEKAIRFYQKFGFKIIASEDFDVGGGHVMDDYVMEMEVGK